MRKEIENLKVQNQENESLQKESTEESNNFKRQLDVMRQENKSLQDKIEARNREADELIYK